MNELGKNQFQLAIALFVLLVVSLFVNLGMPALYLEEPRRAFVALEMLFNNNLWVPTEYGFFYYEKPPFWNWMILLGFKLFGGQTEFAARFFSTFSFVLMGLLIFFSAKRYVGLKHAVFSAFFFLISVDLYFHFSKLAEIDLFYSLITFAAILSVFVFHQQKRYWLLFLVFYLLSAIGFLTKAFPSIVFGGITLLVFFIYKREFKRLFSMPHFVGIVLFLAIVGGYFYMYNQTNDAFAFIEGLWGSTSKRTIMVGQQMLELLDNIVFFPLLLIKNLLPASLLLLFAINKKSLGLISKNPFIEFSFFILIANILIYWLSPGTNQRYVYMLYPFIVIILTYLYFNLKDEAHFARKLFNAFMYVAMALFALASFGLLFIKDLRVVPNLIFISIAFGIAFLVLFFFFHRNKYLRLMLFIGAFILARFLFAYTYLPHRAIASWQQHDKEEAIVLSEIVGDEPVLFYHKWNSRVAVFYLEREIGKIITFTNKFNNNDFFIVPEDLMPKGSPTIYYEFFNHKRRQKFYLIKLDN